MRVILENIASIKRADVDIDGITVIAGENNTGKSTVGKALWALFNSLSNLEGKIAAEREDTLYRTLRSSTVQSGTERYGVRNARELRSLAERLSSDLDFYRDNEEAVRELIGPLFDAGQGSPEAEGARDAEGKAVGRLLAALSFSDLDLADSIVGNMLDSEFNGQARTMGSGEAASISLVIGGEETTVTIDAGSSCSLSRISSLETEAIYFDDPFIVDDLGAPTYRFGRYENHRGRLRQLASASPENTLLSEMIAENSIESALGLIDTVFDGDVVRESQYVFGYRHPLYQSDLDLRNISTGMKTFALMKMLLKNGSIVDGTTVILDEPEIHLHPDWQLVFAEIIVLLHAEFDLHVLLNTHSPYFLQAIEVMSKRHGVSGRCRYYFASRNGDTSRLQDVTSDLEPVYATLANPLRRLAEMESMYND